MVVQMPRGEPFSVPDPLADEWDDMVRENRRLQAKNDPLESEKLAVSGPRKGRLPRRAAGTIDTYVPYGPITLNDIMVAAGKTHELGGERIKRELPEDREQLWTANGLFTPYQGEVTSGAPTPVTGPYDAVIHTHPSNWAEAWPGKGDYGKKVPVYGLAGSRAWVIPPGSDDFYWLK